ncbi:hypothetical protein H2203_007129 [Taxawa tesnikishii (nom. ined.)]|nr:hypothetical protein H2203_007129 [Dothideales sp. JES 119]
MANTNVAPNMNTRILPINPTQFGTFHEDESSDLPLEDWSVELGKTADAEHIRNAARQLKESDIPVAFPTETVYGLGADATRSLAVRGIYAAKQRPSDNPLIVHFASINQLRRLLQPHDTHDGSKQDPIPEIYKPLIRKFWPGPLTIILPNPDNSTLAPEVTAGLSTFGARMTRDLTALVMIKLADVPVAAPSANASTKPSPTAAEHVLHDLAGRIELILDGGPCDVGVESTVVDGLSTPPAVLRPGGISLGQLRQCEGWENTVIGYKDASADKDARPRAPGMKYRHYSPKAPVILFEAGGKAPALEDFRAHLGQRRTLGIVRTKTWERFAKLEATPPESQQQQTDSSVDSASATNGDKDGEAAQADMSVEIQAHITGSEEYVPTDEASLNNLEAGIQAQSLDELLAAAGYSIVEEETGAVTSSKAQQQLEGVAQRSPITEMLGEFKRHRKHKIERYATTGSGASGESAVVVWDLQLGPDTDGIARGLFSALRDMDAKDVDAIIVEGVDDDENDAAAAIMNRLRKAAEVKVS